LAYANGGLYKNGKHDLSPGDDCNSTEECNLTKRKCIHDCKKIPAAEATGTYLKM
jgi:hypothetical protein